MDTTFLDPGGIVVQPGDLTNPRACAVAEAAAGKMDFVRLVECRMSAARGTDEVDEIVVLNVDVQRPQLVKHDIRRTERVAVVFTAQDDTVPSVLSLRADFPLVSHLNLGWEEFPRSLCLYDQSWPEIRVRWTAATFIERIRQWLADTATGTLHRGEQPLEPFLFGSGYRIILPADVVIGTGDSAPERLDIELIDTRPGHGTFIAERVVECRPKDPKDKKLKFIAAPFCANPHTHGVIRHAPRNLEQLAVLLSKGGGDFLGELRERVKLWKDQACLDAALIIVIAIPLRRGDDGKSEMMDLWAFLTMTTVRELGKHIGVWSEFNGKIGLHLGADETKHGAEVLLDVVRPQVGFSRSGAAAASGTPTDSCRTVAVGLGALGSQVVVNLARSGFGTWDLVDDDDLLPHNLGRHALPGWFVGQSKAQSAAFLIDQLYHDERPTAGIAADVLRPGNERETLETAFREAELIIDMAASVPVARHLATEIESPARRMSLFLNPRGTDLVCLAEDQDRTLTLDCVELQYYRALLHEPVLKGQLQRNEGRVRYARTCRDVSFTLPTHAVALHGAIGAQAVRLVRRQKEAFAKIWRADIETCAVTTVDIPLFPARRAAIAGWNIVIDAWILQRLAELRSGGLPNETGGVLLGTYDLPRKTVYVVDTIPSPPDSEEWPTLYIRGCQGLLEKITETTAQTAGQLEYVGEWHSHPDGFSCCPSADDFKVFSWMTDHMSVVGLPALMAIAGEGSASLWFLGQMAADGGWATAAAQSP